MAKSLSHDTRSALRPHVIRGLNAAGEWVEGEGSEVVMEQTKRPAPVLAGSGAGVRVAIVAVKRVTTVEPRAAGR